MGQRNFYSGVQSQFPACQIIAGSFIPNGASAPVDVFPERGAKFTISAPAAGVYTVTLADGPISGLLIAGLVNLDDEAVNSTARALGKFNNITLETAGTFRIVTQSAAGTDANLAGSQLVSFALILSESNLLRA